jgi:hypothetical protein
MQRYTVFFINGNALHISGGSSAHHQQRKTVYTASGICEAYLLLPLAWVSLIEYAYNLTHAAYLASCLSSR